MEADEARIALIAALPREVAGLVRGTSADPAWLQRKVHVHRVGAAVVVAAGMGEVRATLAVEAALACGGVRTLMSVGLAGACVEWLAPGRVVAAGAVIDVRTGERFATGERGETVTLATGTGVAAVAEKRRLAESYGAALVDMEAATVARLAVARGLGFRAIKAVSDAYDFELEGLSAFATADGQFRTGAFALHTALRPGLWKSAAELGRNSKAALEALTERLREVIAAE